MLRQKTLINQTIADCCNGRLNYEYNHNFAYYHLSKLNFEDGDSSPNLKIWVSSPWM